MVPTSIARNDTLKSAPIWVLTAAMGSLLPITIYARKATAILFAIILLTLAVDWLLRRWPLPKFKIAEWSLAGFVVFAALSSAWSFDPRESLITAGAFAITMAGAWLIVRYMEQISSQDLAALRRAFIIGGMIGYSCLAFEYVTSGLLRRSVWTFFNLRIETAHLIIFFKPAVAVGVLYLWPWGLALLQTLPSLYAFGLIAAAAVVLSCYQTGSAVIALLIGIATALSLRLLADRAKRWCGAALAIMILATPWIALNLPDPTQPNSRLALLSNSAIHRIDIWRTAGRISTENPIAGIGFDGSRMLFDGATSRVVRFLPDREDGGFGILSEPIPLHPHNGILQVWLETGLIGALLLLAFLGSIQNRLLDIHAPIARAVGIGFFASALTIASISFGAWQSWWLCAVVIMSAAVAALVRSDLSLQPGKMLNND